MTRFLLLHFKSCIVALLLYQTPFASAEFTHPGVAYSGESITFIRSKIGAGEQPWTKAWEVVAESAKTSLARNPEPFEHVKRGPYNNPDVGSSEFSSDASAAQLHAVCWTLSGEEAHARKSAEILDAWSGKLKAISEHDAALLTGMTGYKYVVAAELLKHTWDGWPVGNQERFATMLREVFYPLIKDFYPSANGNWDASMLQVMIAMGVFLDDQAMFDQAKDYFLKGVGNGAIGNYFKPSGQCQESGRDQAHTQMGLDFLAATCETAWIQGVDLYGALDNRLLKGFEYTAKYNLGHEVPYEPYRSYEGRYFYKKISDDSRGRLRPMYERVFNHYHNRKGMEAPFTKQAVERLRTEREGRDRRGRERQRNRNRSGAQLETLMYAGHPPTFTSKKSEQVEPTRIVHYKTAGKKKLHLHVFEPEGLVSSDRRAAIIFFFGGGWAGGDPKQFYEQAQFLAKQGMVAFSAEYRVMSRDKTTPLECVMDAKSAIRWVREHAVELGVDPDRIVASGGSAGGHLAACTGLVMEHEEAGEDFEVSSVPNLMILFNPVLDTTKETGFGSSRFAPELQSALSPFHQIRKAVAPTIIFHGSSDKTVPFEQAERFTRQMTEVGNQCVLVPFKDKGHGFFNGTLFRPKNDGADFELTMKHSVKFLTEHGYLGPKK